jgi:hypothetical protein
VRVEGLLEEDRDRRRGDREEEGVYIARAAAGDDARATDRSARACSRVAVLNNSTGARK